VDPELLPHLFEPFYSTKGASQGAGLGLPTAHGIVAQSGGWIEVDSLPGHGATFVVVLPVADGPAVPAAVDRRPPGAATAPGRQPRLLLVEDEPVVRTVETRVLRDIGNDVLAVESPAAALALGDAVIDGIDLLVTDVVMPGMSGIQLADVVRSRRPGLPVLFVSGYAPDDELAERLAQPLTGYLEKPCGRQAFASAVRALLEG
jgi:two-component system, cell cycle sensor histidine kinase and response regulator CckA